MTYSIETTPVFDKWFAARVKDLKHRARIISRFDRIQMGNLGDYRSLEEGDTDLLMVAIGNVAKAKGMTEIAQKADLNRQNLYKALSGNGAPKFDTVVKVLQAFGLKLTLAPADENPAGGLGAVTSDKSDKPTNG